MNTGKRDEIQADEYRKTKTHIIDNYKYHAKAFMCGAFISIYIQSKIKAWFLHKKYLFLNILPNKKRYISETRKAQIFSYEGIFTS